MKTGVIDSNEKIEVEFEFALYSFLTEHFAYLFGRNTSLVRYLRPPLITQGPPFTRIPKHFT